MSDSVRKALNRAEYVAKVEKMISSNAVNTVGDFYRLLKSTFSGYSGIDLDKGAWPYDPQLGGQIYWNSPKVLYAAGNLIKPISLHSVITHPKGYEDNLAPFMDQKENKTLYAEFAKTCYKIAKELKATDPYGMGAVFYCILMGETKGEMRLWNGCANFGWNYGTGSSSAFGLGQWLSSNNILYYAHALYYLKSELGSLEKALELPFAALERPDIMWSFFSVRLMKESTAKSWWQDHKNVKHLNIEAASHTFMQQVQVVLRNSESYAVDTKVATYLPVYKKYITK